ncbi:unnamed protein product [Dibothriocephalus latus]|uniref:Uncharacterized protein n=1 Tax=Dibothriocephalus latus TaxID=60516 RepID=A0A3P6SIB7_DIBLA|nr:unnamed protein product [Dibothriocephalus latus]
MALPNRLQHDFITRFCWESFSDATSQADFLLRFIRDKAEDLNADHLIAPLCEFLIKLLMDAEVEHWQSCEKATVEVPTMTPVAQKKPPAPLPTRKAPKSPSSGQPEEGEEGEVIEADEDEGEELDEDSENGAEDVKSSVQTLHKVLNIYRMILAADLFPVIHRVSTSLFFINPCCYVPQLYVCGIEDRQDSGEQVH